MRQYINGANIQPWIVGAVRAVLHAAFLGGVGGGIVWLSDSSPQELAPWAPVLILALRTLEGMYDQQNKAVGATERNDA